MRKSNVVLKEEKLGSCDIINLESVLMSLMNEDIEHEFDCNNIALEFANRMGLSEDDCVNIRYLVKDLRFPFTCCDRSRDIIRALMDIAGSFVTKPIQYVTQDVYITFSIFKDMAGVKYKKRIASYINSMCTYFSSFVVINSIESRKTGAAKSVVKSLLSVLGDAPVVALAGSLYKGDYYHLYAEVLNKNVSFWESCGFRNYNWIIDAYQDAVPMLRCNSSIYDAFKAENEDKIMHMIPRLVKQRSSVYEYLSKENGYEVVNWHTYV